MSAKWLPDVREKDFLSAFNYLTILLDDRRARQLVGRLHDARLVQRRANDLLRASHREALPETDPGVAKDLHKIEKGMRLGPVLVVSFPFGADIADGYHRVSAVYLQDPFALVPCRIAAAS